MTDCKARLGEGPEAPQVVFHAMAVAHASGARMAGPSGKASRFQVHKLFDRLYHEVLNHLKTGNTSVALKLIRSRPSEINEPDESGTTLLMAACIYGNPEVVKCLINEHANVNGLDCDKWTPLMFASKEGHTEVLVELLKGGAHMELKDVGGWTALMWACYKGRTGCVEELLRHGANPNVRALHNMTCLHWAAGRGHTEVVELLLAHNAKYQQTDKYGNTPLIWAARKGHLGIVQRLLAAGASSDVVGMYSWTPLLVALQGGYVGVAREIIACRVNVNATDKNGMTALAIAVREGYVDIVSDLLEQGAYLNVTDHNGDTILMHAVRGGHSEIVKMILRKNPDVNARGEENKTALYAAVDKGNVQLVKIILAHNPDKEIADKEGNTPLLRAVRNRNFELTYILMEKGAKVSAADNKGDTCLHIAMRARNRRMLELLLKNPSNSRLLYSRNHLGETPYNMDSGHQKALLCHIFGARYINSQSAVESQLGYELYSSALADILSSPTLNTPMTVGLFAKWGSGKSFMLSKLKDDMKAYMKLSPPVFFEFSWLLCLVNLLFSVLVGLVVTAAAGWLSGLAAGIAVFLAMYCSTGLLYYLDSTRNWEVVTRASHALAKKILKLRMLLYVMFYSRPPPPVEDSLVTSIGFVFTESTRLTSLGGEPSLAIMIGSLFENLEKRYGVLVVRLFHVFGSTQETTSRFKRFCCIPHFIIVLFILLCLIAAVVLVSNYYKPLQNELSINIVMLTLTGIVGLAFLLSIHNIGRALLAYIKSPKSRMLRACQSLDPQKTDRFLQLLKEEVNLASSLVSFMDRFLAWQTRLVLIIDGLDSGEQGKVLQVLDAINLIIPDNSPFIVLLSLDPHIIIKGIETNLLHGTQDSSLNGAGYLRNLVHLPFYLQNHGLPRMYTPTEANQLKKWQGVKDNKQKIPDRQPSVLSSTLSLAGNISTNRPRRGSGFESITALDPVHQVLGEMPKNLAKNDYFVDVNPRSMRRLMNIIAVAGRLLRANDIEFNWYRLSAWINITEQWPYRTSWILLYYEEMEGKLDDNLSLYSIYDTIKDRVPISRDVEPLLDMDRNEKKFLAFLKSHVPKLNVEDIKKFMPATINLDPYLRKLIKDKAKDAEMIQELYPGIVPTSADFNRKAVSHNTHQPRFTNPYMTAQALANNLYYSNMMPLPIAPQAAPLQTQKLSHLNRVPQGSKPLSRCSVFEICDLITKIKGISQANTCKYQEAITVNNISGPVLLSCDVDELKPVLAMNFGDWQLFKSTLKAMREMDHSSSQSSLNLECASIAEGISYMTAKTATTIPQLNQPVSTEPEAMPRSISMTSVYGNTPVLPRKARSGLPYVDTSLDTVFLENQMIMNAVHSAVPSSDEEPDSQDEGDNISPRPTDGVITPDIPQLNKLNHSPVADGHPRLEVTEEVAKNNVRFSIIDESSQETFHGASELEPLVVTEDIELQEMRLSEQGCHAPNTLKKSSQAFLPAIHEENPPESFDNPAFIHDKDHQ